MSLFIMFVFRHQQRLAISSLGIFAFFFFVSQGFSQLVTNQPPNVLVILADDLGFSDLGCYGGEIETPNLDRLAAEGVRFNQFYNTGRCWPTRASLLTGYYPHQVGFDVLPGNPPIKRHDRPAWATLLPERLANAGYRSYHSGKWHLDKPAIATGFDRSYSLDDHGRYFSPKNHSLDGKRLPAVAPGTNYYATTEIASRMIEFLREHQDDHPATPFFGYLAFTSPHFPLHALQPDIAKYKERYLAGWDQLRKDRWSRIKNLGLLSGELSEVETEIGPPYDRPDDIKAFGPGEVNRPLHWNDLTAEQRVFQATKMAIHAAMIDRMDIEIGRVLEQIKNMRAFDNTLIMFLSDNGASAEIMIRDDGHDPTAMPGSAESHLCLGPGFSSLANTPFRRHKTWVHEGGIHTPFIVHWPTGIKNDSPSLNHTIGHVIDIVPTIMEATQAKLEIPSDAPEIPGTSLLSSLKTSETLTDRQLWWCHEGNQALREDEWKIVKARDEQWQLYNLNSDPTETTDLSRQQTERMSDMMNRWNAILDQFRADNKR